MLTYPLFMVVRLLDLSRTREIKKQATDEIICWWPGYPRAEKGWETIKSLVN